MNYFGNGPKTEATGWLRQMEADVVAVLLEVVFGGALLVAPSRAAGLMAAPITKLLRDSLVRPPTFELMVTFQASIAWTSGRGLSNGTSPAFLSHLAADLSPSQNSTVVCYM